MPASVRLRLPDGTTETLYAGDIIGRTWAAALRIDDPEVSEAHAMVSLRGEQLWLLALRRRFQVEGRSADAAMLGAGLRLRLAPAVELEVEAVELPVAVLGLSGPGLPTQALPGGCSLVFDPHARLAAGTVPDAAAWFWTTSGCWRARWGGQDVDLVPGTSIPTVLGEYRVVEVALSAAGHQPTRAGDGPLRVVASYDTVQVHRADGEVLVLAGQLARVVSELVAVGQPLSWEELARPHWPHIEERDEIGRAHV
jgi:hypothetical protein